MILFTGTLADIAEEVEDKGWEQTCAKSFDWLDGKYADLDALNKELETYDFPKLQDWAEDPDNPGHFRWTRMENADGHADEDGEFEVHYVVRALEVDPKPVVFGTPYINHKLKTGKSPKVIERRLMNWAKKHNYEVTEEVTKEGITFTIEEA